MPDNRSFLTGSYAYGTPRPDSDIDLVALVSPGEIHWLAKAAGDDAHLAKSAPSERNSASLRFGKLNLILVTTEALYDAWRQDTEDLKSRRPVTRDEAVRVLKALCDAASETNEPEMVAF